MYTMIRSLHLLILLSVLSSSIADDKTSAKIFIIGAGPSGIAAASRLLQNGFQNVTILEAMDRMGGRIYSVNLGEYMIDIGAQWVHGEKDNAAFELANPLGLLERSSEYDSVKVLKLYTSSGMSMLSDKTPELIAYHTNCTENIAEDLSNLKTGSLGEYMDNKLQEYFKENPEITEDQKKLILQFFNLYELAYFGADDWHEISAKLDRDTPYTEGDELINWKNRTYATILDILMKKYPNLEEELPVEKNTMLNNKVTKINYDMPDGSKKLTTSNGNEYFADHIIFTASLGVLKADHEKLFDPPLPEKKVNAIKNRGMGHVAKIYLYYENPWWNDDISMNGMAWTEDDSKEMEKDPKKRWQLSVFAVITVEHKPKLLCLWSTGPYVAEMEAIPEDEVMQQSHEMLNKFFGKDFNLTQPTMMKRSMWNTNENVRGTYSYPALDSEKNNASPDVLAEPIMKDDKPCLQFAGEASADYYATVHGAIKSGWREADRLINLYSK